MASWIKQPCMALLKKLNEVPLDDNREEHQLTILMAGLSELNKEMMRRAAVSVRQQVGDIQQRPMSPIDSGVDEPTPETKSKKTNAMDDVPDLDDFDSFDEELDMIEQTLIRSIGD